MILFLIFLISIKTLLKNKTKQKTMLLFEMITQSEVHLWVLFYSPGLNLRRFSCLSIFNCGNTVTSHHSWISITFLQSKAKQIGHYVCMCECIHVCKAELVPEVRGSTSKKTQKEEARSNSTAAGNPEDKVISEGKSRQKSKQKLRQKS